MLPAILLIVGGGAVATFVMTITAYLGVRAINQVVLGGDRPGFLASDNYLYLQLVLAGLIVGLPLLAVRSSSPVVPVVAAIAAFVAMRVGFLLGSLVYDTGKHAGAIISSAFQHGSAKELITPVVALLVAGGGTLLGMSRRPSATASVGAPAPGAPGAPGGPQWGAPQPPPPSGQPFSTQPPPPSGQPFSTQPPPPSGQPFSTQPPAPHGQPVQAPAPHGQPAQAPGAAPFGAAPGYGPPEQSPSGPYAQPAPAQPAPAPAQPAPGAVPSSAQVSEDGQGGKAAPQTMLDASRTMLDGTAARPTSDGKAQASPKTQLDQPLPDSAAREKDE
ncbi:hypothetical protein DZF91_14265 [Actinomadura logoneensis]|uniref:Uncharacterized protein n=1 Tax=Actinomadura logoneensis TaxID=2293572 RepID=A0A372JLR5_9ACTN|nr:hypothetical protein DZF91_14265 [Actinomadura logoneensis]